MHISSFYTSIKLISLAVLLGGSIKLHAQNCDADQASFKRVSDKLQATRTGIKKNEADLVYMNKIITNAIDERNKVQTGMEAVEKGSYKIKTMDAVVTEFNRKIKEYKSRETELKTELKFLRKEEPILLNSFHLIRDRIEKNCGSVKKEQPKKGIKDVAGTYNSPYGKVVLTQGTGEYNVPLTAVVYYDTGGSSTLTGTFDGVHWNYTWRNSFDHHGTGGMIYGSDKAFSGWWIDKYKQPYNKGYWWLRPK